MATMPSIETCLLAVHKSMGLDSLTSKEKSKFKRIEMRADKFSDTWIQLVEDIFNALDLDPESKADAFSGLAEWVGFNKALEQTLWTFSASQQQVTWHILGYSYIPFLARKIAFWTIGQKMDHGMPGGKFWYLPAGDPEDSTSELILPLPQVISWLLDLIERPVDSIVKTLGNEKSQENASGDAIERTLYNWITGSTTPTIRCIENYFSDQAEISFKGCFELDKYLSEDDKFQAALEFIQHKNLTIESLQQEIPTQWLGSLQDLLSGKADKEVQSHFVNLLLERYQKPSLITIRQRLKIARTVQYGYTQLLRFLCPQVDKLNPDPGQNKVLQLQIIFQRVYNLTLEASAQSDSWDIQDHYFENKLSPIELNGLLLSIRPSQKNNKIVNHIAERLTRIFNGLDESSELPNLVGFTPESFAELLNSTHHHVEHEIAIAQITVQLDQQLRTSATPETKLRQINAFDAVLSISQEDFPKRKTTEAILNRLHELAASPRQKMQVILLQLHKLLNNERFNRPQNSKQIVGELLIAAKSNNDFTNWEASIIQYEAKHKLAQNQFKDAISLFKQALKLCYQRNFGSLRGEIARDIFATEVANQYVIPENHQGYYRNMCHFGIFEGNEPLSLEDTARWAHDYFWNTLYIPYPGVIKEVPIGRKDIEKAMPEFLCIVESADWLQLDRWFKAHVKLKNKRIKYAQGDSILMLMIKIKEDLHKKNHHIMRLLPAQINSDTTKMSKLLENWTHGLSLISTRWPEIVNIADFKGQTPLMLAANNNDTVLFNSLLKAGAKPNLQDINGRTALHAAILAKNKTLVSTLIKHSADLNLATIAGDTVLHTAVRLGSPDIVKIISETAPHLAIQKDNKGMTPIDFAKLINQPGELDNLTLALSKMGRLTGTQSDYKQILDLL